MNAKTKNAATTPQGPAVRKRPQPNRRRVVKRIAGFAGALAALTLIAVGLDSARPVVADSHQVATEFTLPTSDGQQTALSSFIGGPVILYFNEGAGCDACIAQMEAIEEYPAFADAGITVLPIVMDPVDFINESAYRFGVTTPFLIDDGRVSAAYGMLGTGMHEGLPGHGFVLVDAEGNQIWSGDYPSMWLAPEDLFTIAQEKLAV